jgi:hypothetical protein
MTEALPYYWRLDLSGYRDEEGEEIHNKHRFRHPDEFAETIKAIAHGKLSIFSSKLQNKRELKKKMYWEEKRFNPSLEIPSSFDYACEADIIDHEHNWNKGFSFPKSRRSLRRGEVDEEEADIQGSPSRQHKTSSNVENVYPFDTEVEVFERRREINPFSKLRTTASIRHKFASSTSTYNQVRHDSHISYPV